MCPQRPPTLRLRGGAGGSALPRPDKGKRKTDEHDDDSDRDDYDFFEPPSSPDGLETSQESHYGELSRFLPA